MIGPIVLLPPAPAFPRPTQPCLPRTSRRIHRANLVRPLVSTPVLSSQCEEAPQQEEQHLQQQQHQQQQQQQQQQQEYASKEEGWSYKYVHYPCSSPCRPGDLKCQQVEALFQNVLNYPRLPVRVCQLLTNIPDDISSITATVEAMSLKYGQELVLYFIRRQPKIMTQDIDTLVGRAQHVCSMLDLRRADLLLVLTKNPNIFCLEAQVVRTRYNALHKSMPLSHEQIKKLVQKFPLILNYQTTNVEIVMDELRQLTYTRTQWQDDFDNITPSIIAFYFRDTKDLKRRLQYLIASGESPTASLKQVFKVSNNHFARTHPDFRHWLEAREARRQAFSLRQQGEDAQQAQALANVRAQLAMQRSEGPEAWSEEGRFPPEGGWPMRGQKYRAS